MATNPYANVTDCSHACKVVTSFTAEELIITACGCYIAGVVSVLLVVCLIRLKKDKKMCFREVEEPFRGKWEGASQKATIQVLKKHTLESSRSNKSMETSFGVNTALNEVINQPIESANHTIISTDANDPAPNVVMKIENENKNIETDQKAINASQTEQSFGMAAETDKDLTKSVVAGIHTSKSATLQTATPPKHAASDHDDRGENGLVKDIELGERNADPALIESTKLEKSEEINTEPPSIVINADHKVEIKCNNLQVEQKDRDNVQIEDGDTGEAHTKSNDSRNRNTEHTSRVIVRDSSGAEIFEKGRDSTAFEPDELIFQNDNFRISQLSYN